MFRTAPARSLVKSILSTPTTSATRSAFHSSAFRAQVFSASRAQLAKRPRTLALASHDFPKTALVRYQTTGSSGEKGSDVLKAKLQPAPEQVSAASSVRHVVGEHNVQEGEPDVDMMAGVKQDIKTIKETFALTEVPKEALYVGLAGVIPYLATSLSTVYLAYDINYANTTGHGLLLSGPTAEALLHLLEPVQIGYGAIIISFLGAIHWGFEWAGFGGTFGYRRYAIGIVATAVAWPTLLLPVEYALISQFLAFTFLYYTDARATLRGWCPSWYQTYRFVLTFVVGASIVATLIGRGRIADQVTKPPGPADRMKALREAQMEELEKEEYERRTRIVQEDEEQEEESE